MDAALGTRSNQPPGAKSWVQLQPKEAPALQRAVLGVSRAYQLATLEGGQGKVTNVAQFPLGLSINTLAQCTPDAPDRSEIAFDEFYIKAGPLRCAPAARFLLAAGPVLNNDGWRTADLCLM